MGGGGTRTSCFSPQCLRVSRGNFLPFVLYQACPPVFPRALILCTIHPTSAGRDEGVHYAPLVLCTIHPVGRPPRWHATEDVHYAPSFCALLTPHRRPPRRHAAEDVQCAPLILCTMHRLVCVLSAPSAGLLRGTRPMVPTPPQRHAANDAHEDQAPESLLGNPACVCACVCVLCVLWLCV